jgi:flagellar hook-length control protein FliK
VADTGAAAHVLQQAGADLRRQLEAQGIDLLRLDISHSGAEQPGAGQAESRDADPDARKGAGAATGDADIDPTDSTQQSTIELPDGVLVDVLA